MLQAVLQSVAGYIDATPLTDSSAKSLATHALDHTFDKRGPDGDRGFTELTLASLLPAWNTAHIRQMMRDTLMAVDAGLFAGEQKALVRNRSARRLLGDVH